MIENLRSMAVFVAVAEEGSFRMAGERLGLSASVVSHHVGKLEERLGTQLIDRSARALVLTAKGRALYLPARRMVASADEALAAVDSAAEVVNGRLRVSLANFLSAGRMHVLFENFMLAYPRASVELEFHRVPKHPVHDGYDLTVHSENLSDGSVAAAPVPTGNAGFFAAPDLAARVNKIEPSEVSDRIPLIQTSGFSANDWRRALGTGPKQPLDFRVVCDDIGFALRMCRSGIGISVLPYFLVAEDLASGSLEEVLHELPVERVPLFVNWSRDEDANPVKMAFLKQLVAYLENPNT